MNLTKLEISMIGRTFLPIMILASGVVGCTMFGDNGAHEYGSFEDLDVDKSGYVESGEYVNYAFGKADWDDDGFLENTEWTKYTERYYDPYDLSYDTFSAYDTDGDGLIERSEFNEVPTNALYGAWDQDDDNLISDDDWDKVTTYYEDNL